MRVVSVHAVLPPARSTDPLHLSPLAACDLLPELRVRVEAVDVGVLGHIAAQELSDERERCFRQEALVGMVEAKVAVR